MSSQNSPLRREGRRAYLRDERVDDRPDRSHADVIALKGDSRRLKNHDLGRDPRPDRRLTMATSRGLSSTVAKRVLSAVVDRMDDLDR